jgi:hypothetical protein
MPQIFDRSANFLSKASLGGLLLSSVGCITLLMVFGRSSYVTRANEYIEQPIQFSHAHHVGDDGIDCRYCHTSVETSAFAGIPPTKTCMNCHSQLWNTAPILEPVRASFRDDKPLRWIPRARPARLRLLQPQHPREEGDGLRDVPRARRSDAAHAPEEFAADGVVPELPPQSGAIRRPRSEIFTMGYQPAEPQSILGPRLVKQYAIKGNTSCSTCHR